LAKTQSLKRAESPKTIVLPAEAVERPKKELSLQRYGWMTKDTPPP
jgi:hypothetical protein